MIPLQRFRSYWIFPLLVLGLFFYHKNPFLSLPYFLDEMGVYIQAVYYMAANSIQLSPDAVPVEFSRGHPLLFTWIYAWIFRWFSYSSTSVHVFSWCITAMLGSAVYWSTRRQAGEGPALLSLVVFLVQPLVLAQSTLVLPEMLLAFFIFTAFWALQERRFLLYVLLASAALLTKESGLIIIAAAAGWTLFSAKPLDVKGRQLGIVLLPLLVFVGWFCWQKKLFGWFFFPLHVDLMQWSVRGAFSQMQQGFDFLFLSQGRRIITQTGLFMIFAGLLTGFRKRMFKMGSPFFWVLTATLGFASVNFFMHRYFLLLFPFWAVGIGIAFYPLRKFIFIFPLLALLLGVNARNYLNSGRFSYDTDYSFYDHLQLQQEAYDVIRENYRQGDTLFTSFSLWAAFHYDINGFSDFHHIPVTMRWENPFTLVAYVTADEQINVIKDYSGLSLIWRKEKGEMKAEVYRRNCP